MPDANHIEELICVISAMHRDEVINKLLCFQGRFPVDFSVDFLSRQPLERLQHIFLALCLQHARTPCLEVPTAA